jgi:hypothetical protein
MIRTSIIIIIIIIIIIVAMRVVVVAANRGMRRIIARFSCISSTISLSLATSSSDVSASAPM